MEDSHFEIATLTEKNDSLFGVFDGHGGSAVAKFCSENFASVLTSDAMFKDGNIAEALRRTYLKLDEMLQDPINAPKLKKFAKTAAPTVGDYAPSSGTPQLSRKGSQNLALNTGCTAVVVHVHGTKITVANTGDSRAVLCREGRAVDLTVDHKTTLQGELDRISAAGGVVLNGRVNGSLNLTRAIGDLAFKGDTSLSPEKQVITANPDIDDVDCDLETDDFIIIACDGLWEVMTSQEVVDYVSHGLRAIRGHSGDVVESPSSSTSAPPTCISELIGRMLDLACSDDVGKTEGLGGDNFSCIIVDLRPDKPLSNVERVSRCGTDPFDTKPESYKAFEFRSGSSSGDDFTDTEWECRIERLDESNLSP